MTVRVGEWVEIKVQINRPKVPALVTHVIDDRTISAVAFSGDRSNLGWRAACADYTKILRGDLPRQWQPFEDGQGPRGAVADVVNRETVASVIEEAVGSIKSEIMSEVESAVQAAVDMDAIGALVDEKITAYAASQGQDTAQDAGGAETGGDTNTDDSGAPTPPAAVPDAKALRKKQIRDAMASLDRANPAHFTKAGVARVDALEEILGYDIGADERDTAAAELSGK